MTTRESRTDGPWEKCEPGDYSDYDGNCSVIVGDEGTQRVAVVFDEADARFITLAANCHDEMLAALKGARQFITNGVELGFIRMPDAGTPDPAHDTLPAIEAAISKAEGTQP